jgi:hypothetical protein
MEKTKKKKKRKKDLPPNEIVSRVLFDPGPSDKNEDLVFPPS